MDTQQKTADTELSAEAVFIISSINSTTMLPIKNKTQKDSLLLHKFFVISNTRL
jgi:hypothetical protein